MRIIAGTRRGHKLVTPNKLDIRPVTDRVKQTIFEIIKPIIEGSFVLDLFAGTGSLGLEALSRGARFCIFVDHSPESARLIQKNLIKLKFELQSRLMIETAGHFLFNLKEPLDIIFLDPPYDFSQTADLVRIIDSNELLSEAGVMVIEHDERIDFETYPYQHLEVIRKKQFGRTRVTFLKNSTR